MQIFPRAEGMGPSGESLTTPAGEKVAVISGGVNVVVQGLSVEGLPDSVRPARRHRYRNRPRRDLGHRHQRRLGGATQASDLPLEIYMEGNIVFRQGDRTVYADRMFYDVRRQIGIILNAELLTPVPQVDDYQYAGLVRLRAAALRQLDQSHFVAQNGLVTTQPPRRAQLRLHRRHDHVRRHSSSPAVDPLTGAPLIDPITGQPVVDHQQLVAKPEQLPVRRRRARLLLADARDRSRKAELLHQQRPHPQRLDLRLPGAARARRLPALRHRAAATASSGTSTSITSASAASASAPASNTRRDYVLHPRRPHHRPRRRLVHQRRRPRQPRPRPPRHRARRRFRGRAFWNHRQHLVGGLLDDWTVQGEVGWISDRTFLEQYYENEWDDNKDQLTGVRLKRTYDNQSFSIEANGRVNDFFTQTQWLPRLDHYWLGQPLIDDQLTWFEHSTAAYANIGIASTPTNPHLASQFRAAAVGRRRAPATRSPARASGFITRQEIDWPIDLAPFKVVPFALGELGHWGEDINGNDIQRAYVHTGVRASIPFWYVDPTIRDPLFNLNGLAHKVVFDAEASYADATRRPQPASRSTTSSTTTRSKNSAAGCSSRRSAASWPARTTFPARRRSSTRSSTRGSTPSAPACKAGSRRPRPKSPTTWPPSAWACATACKPSAAPLGEERIIDWLTFDTNATWFPDADRDNAGADVGLLDYDLRWHLGDRFSILSDGYADTFGDGLRTASIGVLLNRPTRGNAYLGFRTLGGLFDANVVTATRQLPHEPQVDRLGQLERRLRPAPATSASTSPSPASANRSSPRSARTSTHRKTTSASASSSNRASCPSSNVTRKTGIEIPPAGAYGLE